MSFDPKQQTTQVELVPPSTITTTTPEAYGTAIDISQLTGSPLVLLQRAGTASTGGKLARFFEHASVTQYATFEGSDTYDGPLRTDTDDNVTIAWQFTPTSNATIHDCWVRLKKAGTIASAKYVQLKIMTDNSDKPSNTVIDVAGTIDPLNDLTTAYKWINFPFTTLPDLTSGTAYHFVLMGDYAASGTNQVFLGIETAASGGTFTFYTDSWSDAVTTNKPNFRANGLVFTSLYGVTETNCGAMTTLDFPADGVGTHVRAKFKVGGGDGSTSYRVAASLIGKKQYSP